MVYKLPTPNNFVKNIQWQLWQNYWTWLHMNFIIQRVLEQNVGGGELGGGWCWWAVFNYFLRWGENLITSWYIVFIQLETGRGRSAETWGLDNVFPPDDPFVWSMNSFRFCLIFNVRIYISYHWCILNHHMINLEITTHSAEEILVSIISHPVILWSLFFHKNFRPVKLVKNTSIENESNEYLAKYRHYLGREIKVNIKQVIIIMRYQDIFFIHL